MHAVAPFLDWNGVSSFLFKAGVYWIRCVQRWLVCAASEVADLIGKLRTEEEGGNQSCLNWTPFQELTWIWGLAFILSIEWKGHYHASVAFHTASDNNYRVGSCQQYRLGGKFCTGVQ